MSRWNRAESDHAKRGSSDTQPRQRTSLVQDEEGLSTVEYIILLVLIAVLGIIAWRQFGQSVEYKVRQSTTQVNTL